MIPYGRQDISDADIQAVVEVLRSDFLTQGPAVPAFETAVASYCGAHHAIAINSATSGLHLACLALGLGAGDWVWTSPITFVASANAALYCGARIDFVDIDPGTCNLSVQRLSEKLAQAANTGRLPRVVIPVHFAGQPCDMESIHKLSEQYRFSVIEDASHAIGGRYRGDPIGSCRYSDITVFSFHPVKIITTGEGGMALTNDALLADRMARLRSHGITRDPALMQGGSDVPWSYEQIDLGYNYRMTDIQAALGLSQLQRLETYVLKRRDLARRYDLLLADLPLVRPWQSPDSSSANHLYVVRVAPDFDRKAVFSRLRSSGIGVNVHYIPVHLQPYYRRLGFRPGDFPEAERYYDQALSLPLYATLTESDQGRIVTALRRALS